ncbi:MAG: phosphogluconate dehydrogenase (NADP(+)-dependent, decarboxylating) [Deltaproteobacteria bacterium RBG_16_71_12]|nr:MAG: phosphogluconate dehydrogenase (NADP(+)-dependent, decarboxylating) [Deltaproteobacteria bacterium RBG_16_71_12]
MPLSPPAPGSADVGLVGLAVMGQNLVLNMADHGFKVAVYNRTTAVTERFVAANPASVFGARAGGLVPAADVKDFVRSIKRPRRIVILVKAGGPTDAVIDSLVPHLEQGDVVVDGGNALFTDTIRREAALAAKGLFFIGSGVSGGEEGARFGPSLMPGGKPEAWQLLEPVWTACAAKVDAATGKPLTGAAPGKPVEGGVPCTAYIGPDGAGHYVKMVHNGIEYGDMQLICEAYSILRHSLGNSPERCGAILAEWNQGDLDSFLIEISADVLRQKDPATGRPFVDVVLDAAGQKGTGKWTSVNALDLGIPAPSVAEAVFARCISALKDERVRASKLLAGPRGASGVDIDVDAVRDALYCSKLCCYAQGFALYRAASEQYRWNLDLGQIAQIFRGGCIIRARFLQKITEAYRKNPKLENLLLDPYFAGKVATAQSNWRSVVARAALDGTPVPVFSSALSYFDSYRSETLPANLLQAQRDYFGAHLYERVDAPRGELFHIDWPDPKRPQLKASDLGMSR